MTSCLFSRLESEHNKNKMLEERIEEEKRENLRLETELWKIGEAMRNQDNKVETGVNCNLGGGSSLQQEVESLKVVLGKKVSLCLCLYFVVVFIPFCFSASILLLLCVRLFLY